MMSSKNGSASLNRGLKQKEKKSLEHMMQECTNMIGKEKFTLHHQNKKQNSLGNKVSTVSQSGGGYLPATSRPSNVAGFPGWCCPEQVPPLYRNIENYTTSNGVHEISNDLLLPVLLSSGLQREALGVIWEMTNKAVPGTLIREELYATLAIVALFQAGYAVPNMEALHLLPCAPVPVIQFPTLLPQAQALEEATNRELHNQPTTQTRLANQAGSQAAPIPTVPNTLESSNLAMDHHSKLVNPKLNLITNSTNSSYLKPRQNTYMSTKLQNGVGLSNADGEDDFADFQSSVPMQINQSVSDDFDDFKQADIPAVTLKSSQPSTTSQDANFQGQLNVATISNRVNVEFTPSAVMNSEPVDRYAVFKSLNLTAPELSTSIETVRDIQVENKREIDNALPSIIETSSSDDFGDFLCAKAATTNTNFCDATKNNSPVEIVYASQTSSSSQNVPEDAFSNFASHLQFNNLNIGFNSSSEKLSNQSVESPVYCFETDNLDAVSISSFHHSPSHSHKLYSEDDISFDKISMGPTGGDEANEHSATISTSSRGSSSTETGEQVEFDSISISAIPVTDRYSFIRAETQVCLDQVATEWLKCLEKCREVLDEAKSTFYFACNELVPESLEELFETDEIGDYLENITEVFCIVRRIYASSLASGRYTGNIQMALNENDLIWEELSCGISSFYKLPEKIKLDFSSSILSPVTETRHKACGVCLLDVDAKCGMFDEECAKLTYGARQYHASCANFWVNSVDFLLPALQNAELL